MAQVVITDPNVSGNTGVLATGQADPNAANTTAGTTTNPSTGAPVVNNGQGVIVTDAALSAALAEEEVPNLLHTPFDRTVTVMGYPGVEINQITRIMGYRQVKSMFFDYFSIDQRKNSAFVASWTASGANGDWDSSNTRYKKATSNASKVFTASSPIKIQVDDVSAFDETDQVLFKGVAGYDSSGATHKLYYLNGYVTKVDNSASVIEVLPINGKPASTSDTPYLYVPVGTEILILGHALAEEDAHVPPAQALPEPTEQYMQKFMSMAAVTNVYLESDKNVEWGLNEVKELLSLEFLSEIEKTYLFGHKAYFQDPITRKMIRTTGGLFEQLLEEGVEPIEIWKEDLSDQTVIDTMATVFVGNRGSERRNMLTGMDFASALFSIDSMIKQRTNSTVKQFLYNWNDWVLFNYHIFNKPYSMFDMLGFGNLAFVFDKSKLERCVFRAMEEDMLDQMKLQIEDTKVMRCCEISSVVLKYAKCHRLIIMHDGNSRAYDASTNPTGNADGSRDNKRYAY